MRCTLATALVGAVALFLIQALNIPDPHLAGPPLIQAQDEQQTPPATLQIPPPEKPTSIDPAKFVPPPLAKKRTWKFVDLPMSDMLAELSRAVDMPILIDEVELTDVGIPTDEPISDRLNDLPAYLLLDRLADQHGLSWYVDDGIIVVTSTEAAENHLTMRPHVFADLRDAGYEPQALTDLIQNLTGGPWEVIDGIGGSLTRVGDVIFVRQTERMHRQVAGLLEALRHHARETYVHSPPVHESIREKLRVPISVEFVDIPLETVIQQLSEETGIDMHIDVNELADIGIATDEPINLPLKDKPLETVLKYMLRPLGLTAVPDLGRLLITSTEKAHNERQVVLHDVSDVCHSKEKTEQLMQAVVNETEGPWEMIDGIGGKIDVPTSGILVVRQTERQLQEVRELLAGYRQAVAISTSLTDYAEEMNKIETRYYRMNADTARDLQRVLPQFVKPGTWFGPTVGSAVGAEAAAPEVFGDITMVAIDPRHAALPGAAVIPQAVLIIKHTKATHREIDRFLKKVRQGDPPGRAGGGFGGGLGGGGGGLGGGGGGLGGAAGFFSIRPPAHGR